MATTKGTNITLRDASPTLPLEVGSAHGKVRVWMDTVSVTGTDFDADGDTVVLGEIPSNAKILSMKVFNDDLDSATASAPNVGIYNGEKKFTTSTGTTYAADGLIDEDAYATAIATFQSANTTGVELAFEARDINKAHQFVWEDAGLPEDPRRNLRIVFTQTATVAGATTGDVTLQILYSVE